jgi:hypothetical protein
MLPPEWRDYLWLSWLPLGLSVLMVLVLEWRAFRDAPAVAAGDAVQGDTLDVQAAHGVVVRPSAPVAQTNVTNSGGGSAGRFWPGFHATSHLQCVCFTSAFGIWIGSVPYHNLWYALCCIGCLD